GAWGVGPRRDRHDPIVVRGGRAAPGAHAPAKADSAKPARIRRAIHDERPDNASQVLRSLGNASSPRCGNAAGHNLAMTRTTARLDAAAAAASFANGRRRLWPCPRHACLAGSCAPRTARTKRTGTYSQRSGETGMTRARPATTANPFAKDAVDEAPPRCRSRRTRSTKRVAYGNARATTSVGGCQPPATVSLSTSTDPVRIVPRRSTSEPIARIERNISLRLPATVTSLTGYAILPRS